MFYEGFRFFWSLSELRCVLLTNSEQILVKTQNPDLSSQNVNLNSIVRETTCWLIYYSLTVATSWIFFIFSSFVSRNCLLHLIFYCDHPLDSDRHLKTHVSLLYEVNTKEKKNQFETVQSERHQTIKNKFPVLVS